MEVAVGDGMFQCKFVDKINASRAAVGNGRLQVKLGTMNIYPLKILRELLEVLRKIFAVDVDN